MPHAARARLSASKARNRRFGIWPKRVYRSLIDNNDGTFTVPLTKGYVAIVDAADASLVSGRNWYASVHRHTVYAYSQERGGTRKRLSLHRLIMGGDLEVDHRDHNGLNNRRSNLRHCNSHAQNNANMRPRGKYKGVCLTRGKYWTARTKVDGQRKYLGSFPSAEAAALAYDSFMFSKFGEFACLNFPRESAQ
jgi:hypothetical protein